MSLLGTMMEFPLTLDHLLVRAERMFPAVPVVSRLPDRSLHRTTYGQVARRARALAEALTRAGLRPGDRVATLMWNHAAHLETYLGVPLAGGVVHTLNLRLSPEDLAFIVSHANDRFLLVDEVLVPLWEKVRPRASVETVVVVSAAQGGEYEALLATATGRWTAPHLAEGDPCGMCYTSGTTGQSKGVVYSHRSTMLHTLTAGLPDVLDIRYADAVMPVVPMFHANAWGLPYASVMNGAKAVFPGPALDAESVLDLLSREQVTMSAGVPTVWIAVLEALDREPHRWPLAPGLRLIVGGSAAPGVAAPRLRPARHHRGPCLGNDRDVPAGLALHLGPGGALAGRGRAYRQEGPPGPVLSAGGDPRGERERRGPLGRPDHGRAPGPRSLGDRPVPRQRRVEGPLDRGRLVPHRRRGHARRDREHQAHRPHQGPGEVRRASGSPRSISRTR